ncbi:myeloid cell surface antigen CD33-like [Antechinus flavipes]|uniref:myeloid cell surface antigen CD33-like n=1 Tax=Antechinus flavipes TaxID=38775 RepID=UPI00223665A6|nr:myeloid cell surface antigen CD33-like [Antechinus flavipes]
MNLLLLLLLLLLQFWKGSFSQQNQDFKVDIQKNITVQEGLCVSIPCSFYSTSKYKNNNINHECFYQGESLDKLVATNDPQRTTQPGAKDQFYFIGNSQMSNCFLRITGAKKCDQGNYEFHIEKRNLNYSYSNYRIFIKVEDMTQKPEIHMPEILEPSHQVTLDGTALPSKGLASANTNSSKLPLTPQPQDNGISFTCWVIFPKATVSREGTVLLMVADKSQWSSSLFLETRFQGAVVVSIVAVMLLICLVVCLMELLRRKQSEGNVGTSEFGSSIDLVSSEIPLDQQGNSKQHSSSELPPQILLNSFSQKGEDQVQYTSISFQVQKSQEICKPEDINNEYSEIKFH